MKLGKLELELYYNNQAVRELENLCGGDMKNLDKLMSSEKAVSEQVSSLSQIIAILANGAVMKHNTEIALGLADGEKKERIKAENLEMLIDIADMQNTMKEVFSAMGAASKFEVPNNVKLAETDVDLEEIEKEKNLSGTIGDTGCA